MTDQPKVEPQVPSGGGEGQEPPPPFEPDEELITYLEKGRESKEEGKLRDSQRAASEEPRFAPTRFAQRQVLFTLGLVRTLVGGTRNCANRLVLEP
jgi:hypothetical protein